MTAVEGGLSALGRPLAQGPVKVWEEPGKGDLRSALQTSREKIRLRLVSILVPRACSTSAQARLRRPQAWQSRTQAARVFLTIARRRISQTYSPVRVGRCRGQRPHNVMRNGRWPQQVDLLQ